MVCVGFVVKDLQAHVVWAPEVKSCIITHKPPPIAGIWAGMVGFDIFVLVMLFANAVNRPYRENSEIVNTLRRDGIKFLIALLFIRIVNLGLTIFCTAGEILVIVFFLWAMVSVTLSRFLLTVKATERKTALEASRAATPKSTTLWRSSSGYWSRKSEMIELQPSL